MGCQVLAIGVASDLDLRSVLREFVDCKIETYDIDAPFPENTERGLLDVLIDQGSYTYRIEPASTGDARNLIICRGRRNVRIESTARGRDEIDRHEGGIARIRDAKCFDTRCNRLA